MEGKIIVKKEDLKHGTVFVAQIGESVFPIPFREAGVRNLKPGDRVDFSVNREGQVTISSPCPVRGCERQR